MSSSDQLHVPGHWECPLCGFQQIKSILAPGGVYTDTAPHLDPCPNDGRDMIPLTWQRACENQEKVLTHLLDQITTKDEAIAELNTRCSSHLISMMNLASRLTLEVAKWKLRYRHACREMLRSTAERLHLNEQTHLLRKFLKP